MRLATTDIDAFVRRRLVERYGEAILLDCAGYELSQDGHGITRLTLNLVWPPAVASAVQDLTP